MATSKSRSKAAAASKASNSGSKKTASRSTASGKNTAAKKAAVKKSSAPKKAAAKKAAPKKVASKSAAPKKAAAKKSAPAKSASKAAAARKSAPKKAAPKKALAARPAARKTAPSKAASRNGSRSATAAGRKTASRNRSTASRNAKAASDPRNDLEMILIDLMKDIYYAEKKITKALSKMSKKCTNEQLRDAFETHQSETEDQIQQLERAFELIGQKAKAKKCAAMDGLVEESDEHMKEFEKGAGLDVALLVGAQKVEHYEMAAYGSMRSIADTLGYTEAAGIFEDILEQERDTDEKLTQIAETVVNLEAEDEKDGEEITGENSKGGADSEAGEDSSSAVSGNKRGSRAGVEDNDGAGRGISSLTDGNDRGETSETGPAMGY